MAFFQKNKKRQALLDFMTAMKDIAARAQSPDLTGKNDPQALLHYLHESCYMFGKVHKCRVSDDEVMKVVCDAVDKTLEVYHKEDGLIGATKITNILSVQGKKPVPGYDLEKVVQRHKEKIQPFPEF